MGHYASEFDLPEKANEKALAKKYIELEVEIRKLPLSEMTIGDLEQMDVFSKYGLKRGVFRRHSLKMGDEWDLDRIKFWQDKLKKWYKENKKD